MSSQRKKSSSDTLPAPYGAAEDDDKSTPPRTLKDAARPHLSRLPPTASHETKRSQQEQKGNLSKSSSKHGRSSLSKSSRTPDQPPTSKSQPKTSPSEEEIARLREAVNARMLIQQRSRGMQSPLATSVMQQDTTRPQPPSHADSLASDTTTSSSGSAASTTSSRTVRESVPATPAARSARTPSYPFPYVAGQQRGSPALHQPFVDLSPTVTSQQFGMPGIRGSTPSLSSELDTPIAMNEDFMPATDQGNLTINDPRFPTPNLYDLVLQINAEPGLDAWWSTVAQIMHEQFHVERATLAMPADATDIENVPWGQKATFNMNGKEEFVSRRTLIEQTMQARLPADFQPGADRLGDLRPQKLHPERLRPMLESRHSYAGPQRSLDYDSADMPSRAQRPKGPQRVATHAPGIPGGVGPGRPAPKHADSLSSLRHTSITDPEFSSVAGGVDAGPNTEMLRTLRALDHETHPLIEASGIYRVLERGRVVTVTRDYASEPPTETQPPSRSTAETQSSSKKEFGDYRHMLADENALGVRRGYEEYEQVPSSPWAQSPAPSPAIQCDEERNPFFASESEQMEDSFNPANTPKDYSRFDSVEAIGIDEASTVMHIPLLHPTLSQPMQSLRMKQAKGDGPNLQRSNTIDQERKAPIAILSILSSTVPYPPNLATCLRMLGPHLATSFALSQQFAYTNDQLSSSSKRRRSMLQNVAPMSNMDIDSMTLDDLVRAGLIDLPTSISGSITSPSDYSGQSRHSPRSSPLPTPNMDAAVQSRRAGRTDATPGRSGSDARDYFDSKKVENLWGKVGSHAETTPVKSGRKPSVQYAGKHGEEDRAQYEDNTPKGDAANQAIGTIQASSKPGQELPSGVDLSSSHERRHSLLHSYGADYNASFGAPPAAGSKIAQDAGDLPQHPQQQDMPPPSERLLRTIIDSLPVQVFTAAPDTGRITWVNSKFLIYRGQDPQQVLGDPWQAIHPDDRNEYMDTWNRCLKTGQQLQQKVRLQRFDGSYRWFYVRAAPLKDKRQQTVHWIGTNMDFHEQQIAETNSARQQETAASEAKYRALANSSPQIVFAVNRVKGIIFCNSQWMLYSGQTEAQALGVGFMDHIHPADLAKCRLPTFENDESDTPINVPTTLPPEPRRTVSSSVDSSTGSSETEKLSSESDTVASPVATMPQRKLSELASSGIQKVSREADGRQSYSTEVRLQSKDGDYRWHLVRVVLAEPMLRTKDEETWYGTCTDINDHKTLEKNLKDNMDEKSRFLSNMSHEIRTPLNGITGMVNFLIDSNLTAEQMEHVNIIRASTEGLRGLINDILDLSKAEAGMIQLSMGWMYVRDLIEEVNDLTSTMAIEKGLELNYQVDDDVPIQIKGDRFRIRQILLNVVGNAIKFTQKGEVFVRCSLSDEDVQKRSKSEITIRFDVVDTGRGFSEKEAEALFKRFSQIDGSSTRQHGGSGLGLVISQQLAQLHGGDMTAHGVPDKGATFSFLIKTSLPTADDQPPSAPTQEIATIPILPLRDDADLATPGGADDASRPATPAIVASPVTSPGLVRESSDASSAGSDPSLASVTRSGSIQSTRSSMSSNKSAQSASAFNLVVPILKHRAPSSTSLSKAQHGPAPPMFSILVVAPLKYSREATVQHIHKTLPKNVPHTVTECDGLESAQKYFEASDAVIFSHVVTVLQDVDQLIALMRRVLKSSRHSATCMVVITDLAQRRTIIERASEFDYKALEEQQRLLFIFKPLKPSRFGAIFDPQREREMSTDRSQDSAQQVALTQKQVFEQLTKRLGNRDKRVLLVEDNKVNQMVILKFLGKIAIQVETVMDGVQCTEKVFAHAHGHYSIILCDLHMPNKDGYQTCKEIRRWERKNKYRHLPIIALSANVLGDVYEKCVDAGFNSYITKPVDFKELSTVLMTFMDPRDPDKPHEFMKTKGRK